MFFTVRPLVFAKQGINVTFFLTIPVPICSFCRRTPFGSHFIAADISNNRGQRRASFGIRFLSLHDLQPHDKGLGANRAILVEQRKDGFSNKYICQ